jgi:hypothetical protein
MRIETYSSVKHVYLIAKEKSLNGCYFGNTVVKHQNEVMIARDFKDREKTT